MDSRRNDKFKKQKKRFQNHAPRTRKDAQVPRMGARTNADADADSDLGFSTKASRQALAQETLEIIEIGNYRHATNRLVLLQNDFRRAMKGTRTFLPTELRELLNTFKPNNNKHDTEFEVECESTLAGMARMKEENPSIPRIAALNFASAKNPGGGFLNGSMAQEESLAYSSCLYGCLKDNEIYEMNRQDPRKGLYNDTVIFSPNVPVFRDEEGRLLVRPYPISILSVPAVNANEAQKNGLSRDVIYQTMRNRADCLLAVAAKQGIQILILGSWGCGVFGNDIASVAEIFLDLLTKKYEGVFEAICFSVLDEEHQVVFEECLDKVFGG